MKHLLFSILFLVTQWSTSQTLSGLIVATENNGIEKVQLVNLRTKLSTYTNEFGNFTIENCAINDSIQCSKKGIQDFVFIITDFSSRTYKLKTVPFQLDQVVVNNSFNTTNIISQIDIKTFPVISSQELLRKVPGLFIGQHAGGGKAEQIFLRGFDIDHGTDIAIDVDGLPVNMVSHAHGQGYSDLHFLIPETVQKIDFDKGAYLASKGNFATAGQVFFQTKKVLDSDLISAEIGQFNTQRLLGMFTVLNKPNQNAYIATEYQKSDGPFESPQNFKRINLFSKYNLEFANQSELSLTASYFKSNWNASGQIPNRAVDSGLISRFGAIDDTEGGTTSRTNVMLKYKKFFEDNWESATSFYISHYQFNLFSNFTFFLNDPINGDQINQKEERNSVGFESQIRKKSTYRGLNITTNAVLGFRNDVMPNTVLSHTKNRETVLDLIQQGAITETNGFGYISSEIIAGKWTINPALRFDLFGFNYLNRLVTQPQKQTELQTIWSPKINLLFKENDNLNFYFKAGKGFHSNDTRLIMEQTGKAKLPSSLGFDIGSSYKPFPRFLVNTAFWYLHLEQEFVYVGDAGIVEPSGATLRKGFDFGLRYQITNKLFFNADYTYTDAKSIDAIKAENKIPLAPKTTLVAGINYRAEKGFSGSIYSRYLGDRPANESNTILAKGYCITDMNVGYAFNSGIDVGAIIQNVFDTDWNETQFATESRLFNEASAVTEIHFTPGTPFNGRLFLKYKF